MLVRLYFLFNANPWPQSLRVAFLGLGIMLSISASSIEAQSQTDSTEVAAPSSLPILVEQDRFSDPPVSKDQDSSEGLPPDPKDLPFQKILKDWHSRNLELYHFDLTGLTDPFMPIKAVRGKLPNVVAKEVEDANLPPLLKMELAQLKLVAITIFSDAKDRSLASFEDGAGVSYILRPGDRIGRNEGYIVKIEPVMVTIEEFPEGRSQNESESKITEFQLDDTGQSRGVNLPNVRAEPVIVDK